MCMCMYVYMHTKRALISTATIMTNLGMLHETAESHEKYLDLHHHRMQSNVQTIPHLMSLLLSHT